MRKMKGQTVKMDTVTLIGKVRWNLTCPCIKCMKLVVNFFFLTDALFFRSCLRFG